MGAFVLALADVVSTTCSERDAAEIGASLELVLQDENEASHDAHGQAADKTRRQRKEHPAARLDALHRGSDG